MGIGWLRGTRLLLGILLLSLTIALLLKTHGALLRALTVPVVNVEPEGVVKVVGRLGIVGNASYIVNLVTINMALMASLAALASVLIYSSIAPRARGPRPLGQGPSVHWDGFVKYVERLGLSEIEKRALEVILREGGVVTQARLGRELGLSKYQVSRLVKKLEVRGLIERRRAGVTNLLILRPRGPKGRYELDQ